MSSSSLVKTCRSYKNKFYSSSSSDLLSKTKTNSAQLCQENCSVIYTEQSRTIPELSLKVSTSCVASNWHKKKGCFLLSGYKKGQTKKRWTGSECADPAPGSCQEKINRNKAYKYAKSDLIAKQQAASINDCLKICSEVRISMSRDLLISNIVPRPRTTVLPSIGGRRSATCLGR